MSHFDHRTFAGSIVDVPHSKVTYRGITNGGVEHFQNIRYAYETSSSRRFAPPEPYEPAAGSQVDATSPGHACPQAQDAMPPFFAETKSISEDCLNLRIARPSGTTAEAKLPVVIWVHGGGVVKGSAYDSHFEPDKLMELSVERGMPIIYVAINYRLRIFGFARLSILKDRKSLNIGMRDQRLAFQWVKDHIGEFGGDPNKITVFGLSAGGTFASLHLVSSGGEKGVPFTQAWAMSGPPGTALNISSDVTADHMTAVASKLGCDSKDEGHILQCLRNTPMEDLQKTATEYAVANHPPAGLFTFIPSIDEDMIPERQSVLYRSGRFVKGVFHPLDEVKLSKANYCQGIPMVLGWTQDDGALNAGPAQLYNKEDDMVAAIRNFAPALTADDLESLFSSYDPVDFEEELHNYEAHRGVNDPEVSVHFFRISKILRDLLFSCSSIDFGYHMSKFSKSADPKFAGVRLYDLNQSMLDWSAAGMPYVGASHGSDTNYIFNGLFPEGEVSPADARLSQEVAEAFITFAHTGQPDRSGEWPDAYSSEKNIAGSDLQEVILKVIGGPYGGETASLTRPAKATNGTQDTLANGGSQEQMILGDVLNYEEFISSRELLRRQVLERERLLQRCDLINTLAEKLGV